MTSSNRHQSIPTKMILHRERMKAMTNTTGTLLRFVSFSILLLFFVVPSILYVDATTQYHHFHHYNQHDSLPSNTRMDVHIRRSKQQQQQQQQHLQKLLPRFHQHAHTRQIEHKQRQYHARLHSTTHSNTIQQRYYTSTIVWQVRGGSYINNEPESNPSSTDTSLRNNNDNKQRQSDLNAWSIAYTGIGLGMILFFPNAMMCDSGTTVAYFAAYTGMLASISFIIGGIVGAIYQTWFALLPGLILQVAAFTVPSLPFLQKLHQQQLSEMSVK